MTALSVPPAGWYPDRNEASLLRWWDGQQWTDQTQSTAPAAGAFEEPVSIAAFGIAQHDPGQVAQAGLIAPGWYPDNANPSLQRWWDGTRWTTHTAPGVAAWSTPGGGVPGNYTGAAAPAVNSIATRGMIYSLIGLVLNPFAMMSIGGLVLGIRGLRRVPQFSVTAARRGQAITAIVVGVVGTVATVLLVVAAITTAVTGAERNAVHAFDRQGAERDILSQLTLPSSSIRATHVSCPEDPAMKPGDTFDCIATLGDGSSLRVHITIEVDQGIYQYTWFVNSADGTGNSSDDPSWNIDHVVTGGQPFTLSAIEQITRQDLASHYRMTVTGLTCDSDASVEPGDFFECVATFAGGRSAGLQIAMSDGTDGGYDMLILTPPAGGDPGTSDSPPTTGADSSDQDPSHA